MGWSHVSDPLGKQKFFMRNLLNDFAVAKTLFDSTQHSQSKCLCKQMWAEEEIVLRQIN